ncbi:uncharacterized protein [Leptinotarsa decemlineata]|uniref:uncharacterized protein n=1 Tax=Leptinotarsa decemlineata TaxID=7539 RepID=UPI003D30965B
MADLKSPEMFSFHGGNIANSWKLWRQKFEFYLLASGIAAKGNEIKVATLMNLLGDEGIQIYNTFEYEEVGDDKKLAVVLGKFDNYCNPLRNLVYEHFKFFKRDQQPGESVDQFVTALRQLSSSCEFKEKDVLIRDRIVLGIRDPRIQEKLLQTADLQLSDAIATCRAMETSVATQKEISESSVSVGAIKHVKRVNCASRQCNCRDSDLRESSSGIYSAEKNSATGYTYQGSNTYRNSNAIFIQGCRMCGQNHQSGKCSAFNRICSGCRQRGHYRRHS